jgi:hypothetical protein
MTDHDRGRVLCQCDKCKRERPEVLDYECCDEHEVSYIGECSLCVAETAQGTTPENAILFVVDHEAKPILQLKADGDILVRGKKITNDVEIVEAMREFLVINSMNKNKAPILEDAIKIARIGASNEMDSLIDLFEERLDNANQAAAETHRSWKSRCYAIMTALGQDYGEPPNNDDEVTDYWFKYFTPDGHCSLCGNSGVIDTTGTETSAGLIVGKKNHCICPNGRALRGE